MSMLRFWKEIVITQMCSGSVSMIASSAIVTFIVMTAGLSNPYRRIIFGLSISDILQSFGIVAGALLNSSDVPQALWAIGNEHTCRFVGFLFLVGSSAVPMYTLCLGIFYVCKVRGKMTDAQFARKVETKMHAIIILVNLGLYLAALLMGVIHSSNVGNMCVAAARPTGCRQNSELFGECYPESDQSSAFFNFVNFTLIPTVCLVGILTCLAIIFWNVVITERISGGGSSSSPPTSTRQSQSQSQFQRQSHSLRDSSSEENENEVENGGNEEGEDMTGLDSSTSQQPSPSRRGSPAPASDNNDAAAAARGDLRAAARRYKTELVTQACCYLLVFVLSTMPMLLTSAILLGGSNPSKNLYRASALLYPLGGFFNIIVYTRLNVRCFHRRHPECSRLQAFWLVLKAGGEMPSDRDWDESTSAWRICRCTCIFPRPTSGGDSDRRVAGSVITSNPYQCQHIIVSGENDLESQDIPGSGSSSSRSTSNSGQNSSSLFPITHANIEHQESISDLEIRILSRPLISESLPDSALAMRGEGTSSLAMSNDLEGFSDVQDFEACKDPKRRGITIQRNLQPSDHGGADESRTSAVGIIAARASTTTTNDLRGFSDDIQCPISGSAGSTPQNNNDDHYSMESSMSIRTPPMRNNTVTGRSSGIGVRNSISTSSEHLRPNMMNTAAQSLGEDSALGTTGMSQSFDESNPAHRPSGNWDYAPGREESDLQNLESSEILISKEYSEVSSNLSSISHQQDHSNATGRDNKKEDGEEDIWEATFERARRWRPSE